ncbi:MAG: DUF308 domain-containing protein [Bacteroidales bacterium]|nr:DUF308 domain-containing protein [Bacteroidales bacterium]
MNSKSTIFTNVIILIAGVLLCYVHAQANIPHQIIFIAGIALMVPGLINLVLLFSHDEDKKHKPTAMMKLAGWISSIGSVGLGALMIIIPSLFTPILVYIFGFVMIFASLLLIFLLSRASKDGEVAGWIYTGPVLVLIAGVVMVCLGQPRITDAMLTLITGIAMIVFSLSWFTASIMIASRRRRAAKAVTAGEETGEHEPAKQIEATQEEKVKGNEDHKQFNA